MKKTGAQIEAFSIVFIAYSPLPSHQCVVQEHRRPPIMFPQSKMPPE